LALSVLLVRLALSVLSAPASEARRHTPATGLADAT
jgi:hypothetical protein